MVAARQDPRASPCGQDESFANGSLSSGSKSKQQLRVVRQLQRQEVKASRRETRVPFPPRKKTVCRPDRPALAMKFLESSRGRPRNQSTARWRPAVPVCYWDERRRAGRLGCGEWHKFG